MQTAPITLFKGDDLIVKWRFYQVVSDELGADDSKIETLNCVEFDFTIRVNGRLCNFTESFSLCEQFGEPSVNEWSNWYLLVRIFNAFGYRVGDERETHESTGTLKEWLRRILNDVPVRIELPKCEE